MIQNNDGSDLFKTTIPVSNDILNVVSEEDEVNGLYDDDTFDTMYGIYDDDYYDEEYCDGAECNTHTTNANNKKDMNDDGISAMTYDVATAATTSNSNDVRVVKEVKTKAVEENAQTSLFSTRNCRTIQVSACMALVIAIIILLIGIVTAIVVSSTRRETATNRYSPTLTPSSWSTMPPSNQFRCFRSSNELRTSVELYLTKDDISVKEKYGYTIGEWCVDSIQDFSYLFQSNGDGTLFSDILFDFFFERGAYNFNEDISNWNTSSAVDMSFMFNGAKQFNQDISRWDVSKVKNMSHMFLNAKEFDQDISAWNVSSVQNMSHMFENAISFNQDISSWNVSSSSLTASSLTASSPVLDMSYMFDGAKKFNQNLCRWGATMNMTTITNGMNSTNRMFRRTDCPHDSDPDFESIPIGPFCHICSL